MEFLIKNWKGILIAFLLSGLVFIIFDWSKQAAHIDSLEGSLDDKMTEIDAKNTEIRELQDKVRTYAEQQVEFEKSLAEARKKQQQISAQFSKELNRLRNQPVPQDCKAATDWAIENKDELLWPK